MSSTWSGMGVFQIWIFMEDRHINLIIFWILPPNKLLYRVGKKHAGGLVYMDRQQAQKYASAAPYVRVW